MLVQCAECESNISDAAAACPQCGFPQPTKKEPPDVRKPRSKWIPFIWLAGAVLLFNAIEHFPIDKKPFVKPQGAVPVQSPSPSTSKATNRATLSALYIASLRRSLRDPESLDVDTVLADGDATHVCITYRAKNGFGSTDFSSVVFSKAGGDQGSRAWNRYCAGKDLYDEKTMAMGLSRIIGQE